MRRFEIPEKYWGRIDKLLRERNVNTDYRTDVSCKLSGRIRVYIMEHTEYDSFFECWKECVQTEPLI